ncbi:hypothetical protein LXL04_039597 [Taraxacum kok-saghyz]
MVEEPSDLDATATEETKGGSGEKNFFLIQSNPTSVNKPTSHLSSVNKPTSPQTHRLPSNPSRDREKDTREIGDRLDGADEPLCRNSRCPLLVRPSATSDLAYHRPQQPDLRCRLLVRPGCSRVPSRSGTPLPLLARRRFCSACSRLRRNPSLRDLHSSPTSIKHNRMTTRWIWKVTDTYHGEKTKAVSRKRKKPTIKKIVPLMMERRRNAYSQPKSTNTDNLLKIICLLVARQDAEGCQTLISIRALAGS